MLVPWPFPRSATQLSSKSCKRKSSQGKPLPVIAQVVLKHLQQCLTETLQSTGVTLDFLHVVKQALGRVSELQNKEAPVKDRVGGGLPCPCQWSTAALGTLLQQPLHTHNTTQQHRASGTCTNPSPAKLGVFTFLSLPLQDKDHIKGSLFSFSQNETSSNHCDYAASLQVTILL